MTQQREDRRKSRIGQSWTSREHMYNTQATRDNIRHFTTGLGDRNPLYRDPEYAKKTKYGRLVAPGCFLNSVWMTESPGGVEWEWLLPILEGDDFTFTNTINEGAERLTHDGRKLRLSGNVAEYKNQRGQVVARAKGWGAGIGDERTERTDPRQRAKVDREKAHYTPEELQKIYADYDKEVIRGAKPRYWEDVKVGEELPHVVKGPLRIEDIIAWNMGAGSRYFKAHWFYLDFLRRHPALDIVDATTGDKACPELWHFLDSVAQTMGVSRACDYGVQRESWMGHLLTNWVGDDGFVKRMMVQVRRRNYMGDTTWCKGKVTRKYSDNNGEPCVDIECSAVNQRGEDIAPGSATVILPSKQKGTSPLDNRLH